MQVDPASKQFQPGQSLASLTRSLPVRLRCSGDCRKGSLGQEAELRTFNLSDFGKPSSSKDAGHGSPSAPVKEEPRRGYIDFFEFPEGTIFELSSSGSDDDVIISEWDVTDEVPLSRRRDPKKFPS